MNNKIYIGEERRKDHMSKQEILGLFDKKEQEMRVLQTSVNNVTHGVEELKTSLSSLTSGTSELIQAFNSAKGAFQFLEFIAKIIKPLILLGTFLAALGMYLKGVPIK